MSNLNLLAPDFAHELHVVISGHAESAACFDRLHDQANNFRNFRPAIHEITYDNQLPATGMSPCSARLGLISKFPQQLGQFVKTAMNVANDVERPVLVL